MTGREWKPGDVAMLRCDDIDCEVYEHSGIFGKSGEWWLLDVGEYALSKDVEPIRPLVVIDSEDREQVERLRFEIADLVSYSQLREALDTFADPKPPRPDEPTGLGAVIEDDRGWLWTKARTHDHGLNWREQWGGRWENWVDLDVARVLSEGWSE